MKDLGKVKIYVGINIEYNYLDLNEIILNQENYIESLAIKYKIEQLKLYATPIETKLKLEPAKKISTDVMYRNLIGAFFHIASGTRLGIAYSVNYLSRFQNCYNETHFKYAIRVLKYLYMTRNLKLKYSKSLNAGVLDC